MDTLRDKRVWLALVGYSLAIGAPHKAGDGKIAGCKPGWGGEENGIGPKDGVGERVHGKPDQPEMRELEFLAFFAKGAILVFDRFVGFALGVVSDKGDLMTVGAPVETVDVLVFLGQWKCLTAFGGDEIDLGFI